MSRSSSRRAAMLIVALAFIPAACDGDETAPTTATTTAVSPPTTSGTSTAPTTSNTPSVDLTLELAEGDFGIHLVDGNGRTVYLFLEDARGASTCYSGCAAAWPPLTGEATAGADVDAEQLGSQARTDGTDQVTYHGWPLYYYAGDQVPGDANGQGLNGTWFVIDADGEPIGQAG